MKILVLSDSHNHYERVREAVLLHPDAKACFFLGDGASDAEALSVEFPRLPLYIVHGNCDMGSFQPAEGIVPMDGNLIFYTHGHLYQAKLGLGGLCQAAIRSGANIVLYGHTHMPRHDFFQDIHFFNPGSLAMPRTGKPSYGILTFQNGEPEFQICEL